MILLSGILLLLLSKVKWFNTAIGLLPKNWKEAENLINFLKFSEKYLKYDYYPKEGNLENESSDEIEEIDESKQKDNITIDINDN